MSSRPDIKVPRRDDIYLLALRGLFWVLCFGVLVFVARQVWPPLMRLLSILAPFIFGLIVAYVFHPVVVWVQVRLGLGRIAGILTVFALVACIFIIFFAILFPILYRQGLSVFESVQEFIASDRLDALLLRFMPGDRGVDGLKAALTAIFDDLRARLDAFLASDTDALTPLATGSADAAKGILGVVIGIIAWIGGVVGIAALGLIVAFFLLADMSRIPGILRRLLPEQGRERIWSVMVRSNEAVGGFLRGQLIACAGVGLLTMILLFFLGLKQYAILIGFIAGVANIIPYLGPIMGAIPAVLWALFTEDLSGGGERLLYTGLILGAVGLVQAVEGLVFQPFIVGRSASLHPLTVMIALLLGAQFGVSGMLLAVPAACVVKVVFNEYYWKDRRDFLKAGS